MNPATTFPTDPYYSPPARRPYGIAMGIAASLLLHALLLYGYRFASTPLIKRDEGKAVESLTVWIKPPPLPQAAEPVAVRPRHEAALAPRRRASQAAKPAVSAPSTAIMAIAPPAAPAPADVRDPFAAPPPRFDMDAARKTARRVANERDPAKAGTALGQIPEQPLPTETRLARDIAQAKRADCKDGVPGGLLAPLYLMLDKKDSGCKM